MFPYGAQIGLQWTGNGLASNPIMSFQSSVASVEFVRWLAAAVQIDYDSILDIEAARSRV